MKKILIADDEPFVIRLMKQSLEKAGYIVDSAPNGQIAFDKLKASPPDVLITDIQMPVMTGQELCQRISKEMPERQFLIFVLTSRTEIEHREWSQKIPNLQFLEKPVSVRNLETKLENYFQAAASM